jgi:hypothetical protein
MGRTIPATKKTRARPRPEFSNYSFGVNSIKQANPPRDHVVAFDHNNKPERLSDASS